MYYSYMLSHNACFVCEHVTHNIFHNGVRALVHFVDVGRRCIRERKTFAQTFACTHTSNCRLFIIINGASLASSGASGARIACGAKHLATRTSRMIYD